MNHLLVDENLPASLLDHLPIDGSHASKIGERPTDLQLWRHARKNNWVILTRDTDFFDRLMLEGPPPKVIWVRLGNIRKRDLERTLLQLWPKITEQLMEADLIEIHPHALETFTRSQGPQ